MEHKPMVCFITTKTKKIGLETPKLDLDQLTSGSVRWNQPKQTKKEGLVQVEVKMVHIQATSKPNSQDTLQLKFWHETPPPLL